MDGRVIEDTQHDVACPSGHCGFGQVHRGTVDPVAFQMFAHPAEVRRVCLYADEGELAVRVELAVGERRVGEPTAVTRAEFDDREAFASLRNGVKDVDPFGVFLGVGRR
jgi:hypothetical protein